jgi:hypothetical protein
LKFNDERIDRNDPRMRATLNIATDDWHLKQIF